MRVFSLAGLGLLVLVAGCATPLGSAAKRGDDAEIARLLDKGANPNEPASLGRPPLFLAAMNGRASTVKLLIERGADPKVIIPSIPAPICFGADTGSIETVQVLIDHGVPFDQPNCLGGRTPLEWAEMWPRPAVAEYLRQRGAGNGFAAAPRVAAASSVSALAGGARRPAGTALGGLLGGAPAAAGGEERAPEEGTTPQPQESSRPQPRQEPRAASDVDEPGYPKAAERPDDFAIVIGISKYRDIAEAEFAEDDAKAVKRHLLALGYPEENILTLLGNRATKSGLEDKLERWLPMNVNEKSTVFVYYSGHGAPDAESKQAYLVPWDGEPQALQATAVSLSHFYQDLQKLPAKRVLVALDSCFSGAGGRSVIPKGSRPLVTKVDAAVPQDGKLVVFTASQADQISGTLEEQGHGAFTYYLLKGLNGEAAKSGQVTVGSLYGYLAKRVSAAAHRQEREQDPQLLPAGDSTSGLRLR